MEERRIAGGRFGPVRAELGARDEAVRLLSRASKNAPLDFAVMLARAHEFLSSHPQVKDVEPRQVAPRERLATRGEPDETAFLLLDGEVVATVEAEDGSSHEHVVAAPNLVGELSTLTGRRTADLHGGACGALLIAVGGPTFRQLCEDRAFAREYSNLATHRLLGDQRRSGNERRSSDEERAEHAAQLKALRLAAEGDQTEMLGLLIARLELAGDAELGRRTFASVGDCVICEGDRVDEVFVILSGTVRVPLPTGQTVTAGPGSPLGEIAALSAVPRATASVYVDDAPLELIAIPRELFALTVGDSVRRLATERLHRTYANSLPAEAQENLRTIRDQNTEALTLRSALDTVHSNSGIFGVLNPLNESYEDASHHVGTIAQKYRLIDAADRALRAGMERAEIEELARRTAERHAGDAPAMLSAFAREADRYVRDWEEAASDLYDPNAAAGSMDPAQFTLFIRRFERLRWLEGLLHDDGAVRARERRVSGRPEILDDLRGVLDPGKTP